MPLFLSEPDKTIHKLTPKQFSSSLPFDACYKTYFPVTLKYVSDGYLDKDFITNDLEKAGALVTKKKQENNTPKNDNLNALCKVRYLS